MHQLPLLYPQQAQCSHGKVWQNKENSANIDFWAHVNVYLIAKKMAEPKNVFAHGFASVHTFPKKTHTTDHEQQTKQNIETRD